MSSSAKFVASHLGTNFVLSENDRDRCSLAVFTVRVSNFETLRMPYRDTIQIAFRVRAVFSKTMGLRLLEQGNYWNTLEQWFQLQFLDPLFELGNTKRQARVRIRYQNSSLSSLSSLSLSDALLPTNVCRWQEQSYKTLTINLYNKPKNIKCQPASSSNGP